VITAIVYGSNFVKYLIHVCETVAGTGGPPRMIPGCLRDGSAFCPNSDR